MKKICFIWTVLPSVSFLSLGCQTEVIDGPGSGLKVPYQIEKTSFIDGEIERLRARVRDYPNLVELHVQIAMLLVDKGEYREAVREIERAVRKVPGNPRYHMELGRVYQRMGEWADAEACYRRVIELGSEDRYTGPHAARGFTLAMMDRHGEAIQEFQRAIAIDPQFAEAYYFLGSIHDILGDREKTIYYYERYLQIGGPYSKRVYASLRDLRRISDFENGKGRQGNGAS